VLYDDDDVIVIDKPAGIATSSIDGSRNIRDELSEFLRDISKGKQRAWVVHRLDKEVSGVLLFAKSEELAEKIREKWDETSKHYYALVEGAPEKKEGTIKSWLREDGKQKMHSTKESPDAKLAITDYKLIRQYGSYSLLDITTRTGRKNQIRVHLSDIGCPIAGDRKYGANAEYERRVRLHAYSLSFPHPLTGRIISVQTRMPAGFLELKEEDEKYK
jgi:23S rRNA pseudouridine1911/1915/1917 synthase